MSDTPRTDARRGFHGWYTAVDAEFSEKLEHELNAANERIKRLEEQLMDAKNKHSVLVADVVLNKDRAERIKRLEEENNELRAEEARLLNTNGELERRIHRASMAFFRDGSDGHVASQMLAILEEERGKP